MKIIYKMTDVFDYVVFDVSFNEFKYTLCVTL